MNRLRLWLSSHSRLAELIRFGFSGGVCFVVELGLYALLEQVLHLPPVPWATGIAFLLSTGLNYLLCVRWVFPAAGQQRAGAQAGFLITSLIGLLLNEGLMALLTGSLHAPGIPSKVVASVLVMAWNYVTKRKILNRT